MEKKMENGKTLVTENPEVKAEAEKKNVNLDAMEKGLTLPANLPYPKNLDAVLEGKPEAKTFKVIEVLEMLENGKIVIPGYQREFVWDDSRCKALEFSVTRNLPVPPIMLLGEKIHKLIDGQQRVKALGKIRDSYISGIAEIDESLKQNPTAEVKEKMENLKSRLEKRKTALENATLQVLLWPEMADDTEKYVYAALNNGKTHSGSEWGRTFIPAQGMEFVQNVTAQTKHIFGKKAVDFALYLWAGMGGTLKKTPAGKKVFPVVRREAESNDKFVFPEIPDNFASLISAIEKRPQKSNEDYNIGDFVKPGFLIPFVQGLKYFGSWDMELAAYVVKNIDRVTLRKVTIIEKEAKANSKNGPVTATKQFSGMLATSGSGEALTWRKAQAWAEVFRAAQNEMAENAESENKDEMLSELEAAVAEMESGEE